VALSRGGRGDERRISRRCVRSSGRIRPTSYLVDRPACASSRLVPRARVCGRGCHSKAGVNHWEEEADALMLLMVVWSKVVAALLSCLHTLCSGADLMGAPPPNGRTHPTTARPCTHCIEIFQRRDATAVMAAVSPRVQPPRTCRKRARVRTYRAIRVAGCCVQKTRTPGPVGRRKRFGDLLCFCCFFLFHNIAFFSKATNPDAFALASLRPLWPEVCISRDLHIQKNIPQSQKPPSSQHLRTGVQIPTKTLWQV
jgi:hypothetical protein